MKAQYLNFLFLLSVLSLSSCASFENLTDDRTRAEDDEMYWNGKELFYDNSLVTSNSISGDDYYDPSSASKMNSLNGGTNPRASFNPLSGWQLSYGLNAFSNYYNNFGMGLGSYSPYNNFNGYNGFGSFGYNPYGYNPYGYSSYGYSPYSTYNPYGYGYNPYGYGYGLGWGGYGNNWYGGNGWNGNGGLWGGSSGSGEAQNVTHHHRTPTSAGTGNSSSYHRGVLQKNLVQPISETSRTPQPTSVVRANTGGYASPTNARPSTSNASSAPSYSSPSRTTPSYNQPTYATPSRSNTSPSHTSPSPSRSEPSHSSPSYSSPSRSTPSYSAPSHSSTPSHSSSPSRSSSPSYSSPSHSSPSRSASPGRRP